MGNKKPCRDPRISIDRQDRRLPENHGRRWGGFLAAQDSRAIWLAEQTPIEPIARELVDQPRPGQGPAASGNDDVVIAVGRFFFLGRGFRVAPIGRFSQWPGLNGDLCRRGPVHRGARGQSR